MPPSDGTAPQGAPKLPTAADFPRTGPFSLAAPMPRFGARAIDVMIVGVPALIVLIATSTVVGRQLHLDPPMWLLPAMAAWAVLYEFVCVAAFGRTFGKWAVGLRVVRYTDGQRPTSAQNLLRALVPWAPLAIPLGPFGLGIVMMLYGTGVAGDLHRGVPDQAGGTLVISTR